MDKAMVLEAMYETVKESLDWAFECSGNDYAYYMDGVVNATESMLAKLIELETEEQEFVENLKQRF